MAGEKNGPGEKPGKRPFCATEKRGCFPKKSHLGTRLPGRDGVGGKVKRGGQMKKKKKTKDNQKKVGAGEKTETLMQPQSVTKKQKRGTAKKERRPRGKSLPNPKWTLVNAQKLNLGDVSKGMEEKIKGDVIFRGGGGWRCGKNC